ncbi:MAG: hypothetical protein Q8R29_01800 [bacterium]|nr:hypothetical protein [bacterium]
MFNNRFSSPKTKDTANDALQFVGNEVVLYRKVRKDKGGDERVEIKRLPVSALFKELKNTLYNERLMETPLLPEGVRYFAYKEDVGEGVLVLEQFPQSRTVNWTDKKSGDDPRYIRKVKLAFPFVILICKISAKLVNEVRVFYRTSPINSLEDPLFHTNLRNTYPDVCKICLGIINTGQAFGGDILPKRSKGNLVDQADQILNKLWNRCFNADVEDEFEESKHLDKRIASVEAWRKATEKDEMFPLSIRWRTFSKNIIGVVRELGYGYLGQEEPLNSLADLLDIFYCCAPEVKPKAPVIHNYDEGTIGDYEMQGGEFDG